MVRHYLQRHNPFNRTTVECKFQNTLTMLSDFLSFNRTTVECKS